MLSKLQYKNYEPGEFTGIEERILEEVTELIHSFPWQEQRHFTPVGPTCPSVTVEDAAGNYLKLGHSYYEQYCLYLLTADGRLSKKVLPTLDEGIVFFSRFFNGEDISAELEHEFALQPQRHFVTKEFIYRIAYQGTAFSIALYSLVPFILLTLLLIGAFAGSTPANKSVPVIAITLLCSAVTIMLLFFAVQAWRMLANHYHYAKDQLLQISKGRNEFIFGTEDHFKTYRKDEIAVLKEYRNTQSKNPWSGINYTEVTFKNGEQIKTSSLLMKSLYMKFPDVKWELVSTFLPMIR